MRFQGSAALTAPDLAARWSAGGWPSWCPGAQCVRDGQIELTLPAPRPLRALLQVRVLDDRAEIALIEGDLSSFSGELRLETGEGGPRINASLDIGFPVAIPGTLQRDLIAWFDARLRDLAHANPHGEAP